MSDAHFDDELWDEYRWEEHLQYIDNHRRRLRSFIHGETDEEPRWLTYLYAFSNPAEAVEAYIEDQVQTEEQYYFDDEEEEDEWPSENDYSDVDDDESDWLGDDDLADLFDDDEAEDDYEAGEEWKALSPDFAQTNEGSIEQLVVYANARALAADVLYWFEGIHPKAQPPAVIQFVNQLLTAGTKLACGYTFGFEKDFLGGNIACTKRALYAANAALRILHDDLKEVRCMPPVTYQHLHDALFMLRNQIGLYIQDLREQFYDGLYE